MEGIALRMNINLMSTLNRQSVSSSLSQNKKCQEEQKMKTAFVAVCVLLGKFSVHKLETEYL